MYVFEKNLKDIIIACSKNIDIRSSDINIHTDLINDCNFDSVCIIELIAEIERYFNIEIDDEYLVLDNISIYKNLCEILNEKIKKKCSEVVT